jgi:hypothetical protein
MPDRMSNIVLFETEEEVKAYKSVLGEGYKRRSLCEVPSRKISKTGRM